MHVVPTKGDNYIELKEGISQLRSNLFRKDDDNEITQKGLGEV
jgi:hypothetical protein